jgi:hypothetical protein
VTTILDLWLVEVRAKWKSHLYKGPVGAFDNVNKKYCILGKMAEMSTILNDLKEAEVMVPCVSLRDS